MKRPDYPFRAFEFDNYWVCEFPDLSGCIGTGETQLEAVKDALEASELWLAVYYEDNGKYPPVSDVNIEDERRTKPWVNIGTST